MSKYNCSENTKFPSLKFTCQGDKNKFLELNTVIYKKYSGYNLSGDGIEFLIDVIEN